VEQGWFKGKITWVVYVLSVIQLVVFIAEIARNAVLTKTPIQLKPSFNPMIGPSPYVLISMGARYQPCMHTMPNVQNNTIQVFWPCPNATATTGDSVSCQLSDLCHFSADRNPKVNGSLDDKPAPDQWWRFIVPIFLHAGLIHIGFNLLLQLTLGRDVELLIGSVRFAILYFAAGIFGFILGANFAATGIASTGCSGSLFGILAIILLDLLYTWKERKSPIKDLLFIIVDIAIAFVLGLLPGLDNFSHIGGFLMGLVLGICLMRSPSAVSRRTHQDDPVYTHVAVQNDRNAGLKSFVKDPLGFFKNRRGIWWAWWLLRALALIGVLVAFIVLLKNFYVWRTGCSWCKYLSCLPIKVGGTDWCSVG
jgi:membrane associated rhomboid family serine protease